MAESIKRNDKITTDTECGVGIGHVHTVVAPGRFFVQVKVGAGTLLNKYLDAADEDKTWVRGHDVNKLQMHLAASAAAETMEK